MRSEEICKGTADGHRPVRSIHMDQTTALPDVYATDLPTKTNSDSPDSLS
jgi:hypothetical protein